MYVFAKVGIGKVMDFKSGWSYRDKILLPLGYTQLAVYNLVIEIDNMPKRNTSCPVTSLQLKKKIIYCPNYGSTLLDS